MIQVRCPKCNTALSLKQAPPAGKIKCPKCAAIIAVSNAPAASSQKSAPQNVAAKPAIRQTPKINDGEIDFGSIPIPTAPTPGGEFPIFSDHRVYDGPVQLDPIPKQRTGDEDEDDDHDAKPAEQAPKKKKRKKTNPIRLIIGLVVLVLVCALLGGIVYWKFGTAPAPPTPATDPPATTAG